MASDEIRFCGTPIDLRILGDEVLDEQRDVLAPLAQRRQRDRDDVDAVEEILAERSRLDRLGEIAVRGGDDAHVDLASRRSIRRGGRRGPAARAAA